MLKTDSLREAMTRSCRWCQANPEKFTIFVESGNIETTGETPSFVYRYQMVMFVMDFSIDVFHQLSPFQSEATHCAASILLISQAQARNGCDRAQCPCRPSGK